MILLKSNCMLKENSFSCTVSGSQSTTSYTQAKGRGEIFGYTLRASNPSQIFSNWLEINNHPTLTGKVKYWGFSTLVLIKQFYIKVSCPIVTPNILQWSLDSNSEDDDLSLRLSFHVGDQIIIPTICLWSNLVY